MERVALVQKETGFRRWKREHGDKYPAQFRKAVQVNNNNWQEANEYLGYKQSPVYPIMTGAKYQESYFNILNGLVPLGDMINLNGKAILKRTDMRRHNA